MSDPVCMIVGAGPGNGAAFARRFAAAGYRVAALARQESTLKDLTDPAGRIVAYVCDATDPPAVQSVHDRVTRELGAVEVLIYNASSRDFADLEHTSPAHFERAWRTTSLGLFLAAKAVVPSMRAAGRGAIIVIGATASWRGGAGFVAFAAAKAAQRSLAQSLAHELGPAGIHVAHVVIDAIVDMPASRRLFADQPDDFFARPDDIAETVWFLARQPRSAWTFELDVRPYAERWS
jgi:NAD(P)-dependent dehydrogenase (short-subunit alcohol dehydrogenase family)